MSENKFDEKFAEEGGSTAFAIAWNLIKSIASRGLEYARVKSALFEYAAHYEAQHGMIKVLGMTRPVPLFSVYTAVRLADASVLRRMESIETMEQAFREKNERGFFPVTYLPHLPEKCDSNTEQGQTSEKPLSFAQLREASEVFQIKTSPLGRVKRQVSDDLKKVFDHMQHFSLSDKGPELKALTESVGRDLAQSPESQPDKPLSIRIDEHTISLQEFLSEIHDRAGETSSLLTKIPHRVRSFEDAIQTKLAFGRSVDALDVANSIQFLNILGQPGCGKTTFLRRLGLEALLPKPELLAAAGMETSFLPKSRYKHDCIPIYIELKRLRSEEIDIEKLIVKEFERRGLPEAPHFVSHCLKAGKLLILLDGVDEIPKEKLATAVNHIQDFVDQYPHNRFVTSCRTAFYKTFFKRFLDVTLIEFDDLQIRSFVRNWFASEEEHDVTASLLTLLFNQDNASTLELARTPLLLIFVCVVFQRTKRLPANRSVLYKHALEILLTEWAAEKMVHHQDIYANVHPELEILLLADVAGPAFEKNKLFFSGNELSDRINEFLRNTLDATSYLNRRQILDAIEVQQGIFVERAHDVFTFSHLTIQEYLTAHYFFSNEGVDDLILNHLCDVRWREVFLLLSGMCDAGKTLVRMSQHAESLLSPYSSFKRLMAWVEDVHHQTAYPEQNAARRVALTEIGLSLAGCQHDLDDSFRSLASALDHNINDEAYLHGAMRSRIESLYIFEEVLECWLQAGLFSREASASVAAMESMLEEMGKRPVREKTHAPPAAVEEAVAQIRRAAHFPEQLKFKDGFVSKLENYLYACLLIVDCRKAALRVGRKEWESVLGRFFTVANPDRDRQVKAINAL